MATDLTTTKTDLRSALEAHAAACREAITALRHRPDLPAELRANLAGAYLADANLAGAYLADANLAGANLTGANGIVDVVSVTRIGSRWATLTATKGDDGTVCLMTGCFSGTLAEFEAAVAKRHGDNEHGRAYAAAVAMIRARFGMEVACGNKDCPDALDAAQHERDRLRAQRDALVAVLQSGQSLRTHDIDTTDRWVIDDVDEVREAIRAAKENQ